MLMFMRIFCECICEWFYVSVIYKLSTPCLLNKAGFLFLFVYIGYMVLFLGLECGYSEVFFTHISHQKLLFKADRPRNL